jgi:transposase
MIQLPRAVRVFAHREPVDMRKSYDTLAAVVRLGMDGDVMGGDVFVFVGRRRRHAKVLWWDGTGMLLLAKRLVKGRFGAPWESSGKGALRWTMTELALFLEGSELVARGAVSPPAWDPSERCVEFR